MKLIQKRSQVWINKLQIKPLTHQLATFIIISLHAVFLHVATADDFKEISQIGILIQTYVCS